MENFHVQFPNLGWEFDISRVAISLGSFKVYCAKSEKKLKSYTAKFGGYLGGELTVSVKGGGSFPASLD